MAAERIIEDLFLRVSLQTDEVQSGLNSLRDQFASGLKEIAMIAAGPLKAALDLGAMTRQYLEQAGALQGLAKTLSASVQDLDAWGAATQVSGGSTAGFQQSIKELNTQLVQASALGGTMARAVFAELGVSVTDAAGKSRAATDVLMDLAGAAEKMDTARFTALASKLGLDEGTIQLLRSGQAEAARLTTAMRQFAYTGEDAAAAADFNSALATMAKALQSVAAVVLRVIIPPLTLLTGALTEAIAFMRQHEPFIQAFFLGMATVITASALPAFLSLAAAALPLMGLVAAIGFLAAAVDDFLGFLNGKQSLGKPLYRLLIGDPAEARQAYQEMMKVFTSGEEFERFFTQDIPVVFRQAWEDIKGIVQEIWQSLIEWMVAQLEAFAKRLGKVLQGPLNALGNFADDVADTASGVWESVKETGKTVTDAMAGTWAETKNSFTALLSLPRPGEITNSKAISMTNQNTFNIYAPDAREGAEEAVQQLAAASDQGVRQGGAQ